MTCNTTEDELAVWSAHTSSIVIAMAVSIVVTLTLIATSCSDGGESRRDVVGLSLTHLLRLQLKQ